jgi:hypothetical protein
MKKLLLALMIMVGTIVPVMAEETAGAYFRIPGTSIDFVYPFYHIDFCPYVHSVTKDLDMLGADMRVVSWPGEQRPFGLFGREFVIEPNFINVNGGYVTSDIKNGMPYGSVSVDILKLTTRAPDFLSYIALGYAHDFRYNENHFLINTAIPLQDILNLFRPRISSGSSSSYNRISI